VAKKTKYLTRFEAETHIFHRFEPGEASLYLKGPDKVFDNER
jgi:hypothetical protein